MFIVMDTNKSTSRRHERAGDQPSGGSRSANVRARVQKPHTRLSPWASWHNTSKSIGLDGSVNAAFVHGEFTFLSVEICASRDRRFMRAISERSIRLSNDKAYPFVSYRIEGLLKIDFHGPTVSSLNRLQYFVNSLVRRTPQ